MAVKIVVSLCLCFVTVPSVQGHGHMSVPLARNAQGPSIDNGAVGGGPGSVHEFDGTEQITYQHGICGNAPRSTQVYNRVGNPEATFTAGATANISVIITAHHVGFFEFELCEDAGQLSEECFAKHRLLKEGCECNCPPPFAVGNSCPECDACRRYWKPLQLGEVERYEFARKYDGPELNGLSNIVSYEFTMAYVIPAGIKSSRAVLRWHYLTTNSCSQRASSPEEFWNCADIRIADGNGDVGDELDFDNAALENLTVKNLIPKIEDETLLGVYSSCQDGDDGLLTIGAPEEYNGSCGMPIPENNSFELCSEIPGPNATEICEAVEELDDDQNLCKFECSTFYYECSNGVVFLQSFARGVACKDNRQVLEAECDDLAPIISSTEVIAPAAASGLSPRLLGTSPEQKSVLV